MTMRKKQKSLTLVLAAVVAAALIATWALPLKWSYPAPAVSFELLDGRRLALSDLAGQAVLVNFWATTCPPCVEEMPELVRLQHAWRDRGLTVIGVAMPYDPPSYVASFQKRHSISYPIALDVQGVVTKAFGNVSVVPTSFLIDPKGRVVFKRTGRIEVERIERLLRRHLEDESDDA